MPQTSNKQIEQLAYQSPDCTLLITHLIRQKNANGRKFRKDKTAKEILKKILHPDILNAKVHLKARGIKIADRKLPIPVDAFNKEYMAVCFTESTFMGLAAHCKVYGAKYGISIVRKDALDLGISPCLNINQSLLYKGTQNTKHDLIYVFNKFPHEILPYVNILRKPTRYDPGYDNTHEKEWRVDKDIYFDKKYLWFVFCPVQDFQEFKSIQNDTGRPCLFDLNWLRYL